MSPIDPRRERAADDRAAHPGSQLAALFDGELSPAAADELRSQAAADPQAQAELDDLAFLRAVIGPAIEREAAQLPQARFEQVWDRIERALDREAAATAPANAARSQAWWARGWGWPLVLAGSAAAVVALIGWPRGPIAEDTVNPSPSIASVSREASGAEAGAPDRGDSAPPAGSPSQTRIASGGAPPALLPPTTPAAPPGANDAEIERIEFGGRSGRISTIEGRRGTTTVIWVSEEEPVPSERSL